MAEVSERIPVRSITKSNDVWKSALWNESGGHRWQRIPPTERRGRVQTSTITVAVFVGGNGSHSTRRDIGELPPRRDVEETAYRASGPGGQHRNKKATAVRLHHKRSGIVIRVENSRDFHANRKKAWKELGRKLKERAEQERKKAEAKNRKNQIGSGERGDKRRTIAVHRDMVVDHVSGWRTSYKKYMRGDW